MRYAACPGSALVKHPVYAVHDVLQDGGRKGWGPDGWIHHGFKHCATLPGVCACG